MPSRLARASSSCSSASRVGSGFGEPSSRKSAFLDRIADFSNVPPTPTPRMSGGQASGPAFVTHSITKSFTPGSPAAARDVHVLPQLDEADHHACVLAVRDLSRAGQLGVLLQDRQHLLAGGRALGAERTVEGAQHVGLEAPVRLHAELLDGVRDGRDVDLAHQAPPGLSFAIADFARSACSRGDTSSLWVARLHWLPNGSSGLPKRSPQNMAVSGMRTLQPASTARLNAASTSGR